MARLTAGQARRLALAAQGLHRPRPARPGRRELLGVAERVGIVRIDSVSALVRAHYLTFFSRLGPYDRGTLDALCHHELPEVWCVGACFAPRSLLPALAYRRAGWEAEAHELSPQVLAEITERGPCAVSDLSMHVPTGGTWWAWSGAKKAVEHLWGTGQLHVTERRRSFERVYDLAARVVPDQGPDLDEHTGRTQLLLAAAGALGVATDRDLATYHHQRPALMRPILAELLAAGRLEQVEVEGWDAPGFMVPGTTVPRSAEGIALLGPFDNLLFHRERIERLWGMRFLLEIYVPEPKRVYGYYVLPFLLGEELVARVDLRADRKAGVLRVPGVYGEPGMPMDALEELAIELRTMASWLGLERIEVGERGDLAFALRDFL